MPLVCPLWTSTNLGHTKKANRCPIQEVTCHPSFPYALSQVLLMGFWKGKGALCAVSEVFLT